MRLCPYTLPDGLRPRTGLVPIVYQGFTRGFFCVAVVERGTPHVSGGGESEGKRNRMIEEGRERGDT